MAGAGAVEIELAKRINSYGEKCPGLAQYAIQKFAESLEELPRALATNSGVKVGFHFEDINNVFIQMIR